jgi:uncharacterized protein involved in type VI secretion and phage assembly
MTMFSVDKPMATAARAAKKRGVWLAIVVDNQGNDNPAFRVRVKYPWLSDQEASFWARIAVPMAGADRGSYMLPELDDQVLVVFEHGDLDRPIVIGAVWSHKQPPVEHNTSGDNNTKLIKSRAGHRLVFDDERGAEMITIVDSTRKNKIVLDAARKTVKIEAAGDIEIRAQQNVIIQSLSLAVGVIGRLAGDAQSVLVHATKAFGLKASSKVVIGGSQVQTNVTSSPACQVSGTGAGQLGGIEDG